MHKPTTSAFLSALLKPVAADTSLEEQAAAIHEALDMVQRLKLSRDAASGRQRDVEQIILDWWEQELVSVTGGLVRG